MDLSQLFAGMGQPSGLLTPEQSANVNQDFMANLAAGLMKAGGPSPYKPGMTTLSGIGEALQGGLAARRQSQQDALTQTLVRANTMDKIIPFYNLALKYDQAEVPRPAYLQNALDHFSKTILGGRVPGVGGAPGIPGAPSAGAGAAGVGGGVGGGGARADAGVPGGDTTGASPMPKTPKEILKEAGFGAWAGTPEGLNHEAAMDYLKRYMTETDPRHREFLQQQELFKNTLPTTMKEISERQSQGLPITDQVVAPLRAAGASEKFINQLTGRTTPEPRAGGLPGIPGGAPSPGGMPPPGTLPSNMAALLGGAPPVGGPPAGPPGPPAAPPQPPPMSPPMGGPTASPGPPAAAPGLPMPPPTAGTPTSPLAPPVPPPGLGMPPAGRTVASQLGIPADETPAQQMERLHIKPEDLLSSSPRKAWAEETIKADTAANSKTAQAQKEIDEKYKSDIAEASDMRKTAEAKRLDAQYGREKAVFDKRVEHDTKQMPVLHEMGANAIATMQNNQMSRDLIADPNFRSGAFGPLSETWNSLKAGFGIDPNAAFSQNVFNKVTAKNALDMLDAMKGQAATMEASGAGRVLLQTYTTILKAVQSVGIGESSNIFLSRLTDSLAKQQLEISKMALRNKSESKDGLLDGPKFDADVLDYLEKNPAYKPGDLAKAKAEGALLIENKKRIAEGGPPKIPNYPSNFQPPPGAKKSPDGGWWIQGVDPKDNAKPAWELLYP